MTLAVIIAAALAVAVPGAPKGRASQVTGVLITQGATEQEALALLVTAWRESSLLSVYERCEKRGLGGAIGLWQEADVGDTADILCAGGIHAQAHRAIGHWRACTKGGGPENRGVRDVIACYMARKNTDNEVKTRAEMIRAMEDGT